MSDTAKARMSITGDGSLLFQFALPNGDVFGVDIWPNGEVVMMARVGGKLESKGFVFPAEFIAEMAERKGV